METSTIIQLILIGLLNLKSKLNAISVVEFSNKNHGVIYKDMVVLSVNFHEVRLKLNKC